MPFSRVFLMFMHSGRSIHLAQASCLTYFLVTAAFVMCSSVVTDVIISVLPCPRDQESKELFKL